jgi:hypothetical protein
MLEALKSLGNALQLAKVAEGTLKGEEAATALRQALAEIHAAEETIAGWRRLVSNAEMQLVYGKEGRPQKFGPSSSFIVGAG